MASDLCAAWFVNSPKRLPWVVLGGQTGTGKTHISRTCFLMIRERCIDACLEGGWQGDVLPQANFWNWPVLCALKREEFDAQVPQAATDSFLFVDDLGAESEGFKNNESLARLLLTLDHRDWKFTLMTTNIPRERWAEAYDQRIADRLMDAAYVDLFDVQSYRVLRRKA